MAQTYMEVNDSEAVAHQWNEYNKALIASWEKGKYGRQGGRPHKSTVKPPSKPSRLLRKTSKLPLDKPDKSRGEGSGVDETGGAKPDERGLASNACPPAPPSRFEEIKSGYVEAWEGHFKTKYAFNGGRDGKAIKVLAATPMTVQQIVECAKAGWSGTNNWLSTQSATLHGFTSVRNNIVAATGPTRQSSPGAALKVQRSAGCFAENIDLPMEVYTDES
jgi:hypothetical protein